MKTPRKKYFDYTANEIYFVTIVVMNRRKILARELDYSLELTPLGKIVNKVWSEIPAHFGNVELGVYKILSDHFPG